MLLTLHILAWLAALLYLLRTAEAQRGIPTLADLTLPAHDLPAPASIAVIVPARNEQAAISACIQSLLAQDAPQLHILAVDDRSTDATPALLDDLAAQHPDRLTVLHVAESLPSGWLGKTHAMALAAAHPRALEASYLLFTDADVFFAPSALRRAVAYAAATRADHLILFPTPILRSWSEASVLAFFQLLGFLTTRPWRLPNPRTRQSLGVGAFNLLTRSAYHRIGGFASLRMVVVEDLALGLTIRRHGLSQRAALGPNLVRLHWAAGASGIVHVMTKNVFSVFRYRIPFVLAGILGMLLCAAFPFVTLFIPGLLWPSLVALAALLWAYALLARISPFRTWNVLFLPFAALTFAYALARSTVLTLARGGVLWRGTLYPLAALRRRLPRL